MEESPTFQRFVRVLARGGGPKKTRFTCPSCGFRFRRNRKKGKQFGRAVALIKNPNAIVGSADTLIRCPKCATKFARIEGLPNGVLIEGENIERALKVIKKMRSQDMKVHGTKREDRRRRRKMFVPVVSGGLTSGVGRNIGHNKP